LINNVPSCQTLDFVPLLIARINGQIRRLQTLGLEKIAESFQEEVALPIDSADCIAYTTGLPVLMLLTPRGRACPGS
jgi:hypothetical protein